jgi:hypothetical protein
MNLARDTTKKKKKIAGSDEDKDKDSLLTGPRDQCAVIAGPRIASNTS